MVDGDLVIPKSWLVMRSDIESFRRGAKRGDEGADVYVSCSSELGANLALEERHP